MLMIFEIVLTIACWRKGWKGYALVPGISTVLAGFMVGVMAGAAGYSEAQFRQLKVILLPLDFICVGVLIWMAAKGRKVARTVVQNAELVKMEAVTAKA